MSQRDELLMWGFKFKGVFCSACDKFEWHIQKSSGEWDCLGCRVKEPPLESRSPHLFRDKEENRG